MADMEVDSPNVGASVQAGKKKKQDGPRFEVKKVSRRVSSGFVN
jgi:hypothetical protein